LIARLYVGARRYAEQRLGAADDTLDATVERSCPGPTLRGRRMSGSAGG